MFELEAKNATLENPQVRYEMHGEEQVPAMSLKFKCESNDHMAGFLLSGEHEEPPKFWDDSEHRDSLFYGMKGGIKSAAEFEDCEVKFQKITIKEAKVKDFEFEIISGRKILLMFTVQCSPEDKQITSLIHLKKKGGKLTVSTEGGFNPEADPQLSL